MERRQVLIQRRVGQQVVVNGGVGPGYGVYTVTLDGETSTFSAARTTHDPTAELFRASDLEPIVLYSLVITHADAERQQLSIDQVRVAFE